MHVYVYERTCVSTGVLTYVRPYIYVLHRSYILTYYIYTYMCKYVCVRMHIILYTNMCTYVCMCVRDHTSVRYATCVRTYVRTYVHIDYVRTCVSTCVRMHKWVCTNMCKYVCTCACYHICMCTYVHTCRITYMYIFVTIFATILLQT